MSLVDQIAADVSEVFLNPADFAVPVTVTRGATTTDPFNAVVGSSHFQVSTEFGIAEFETRDFNFEPADLDFGSGPVMPQRGDVFTEGGFKYVVSTPTGIDFYSLDENRQLMTVHTTKTNA